jgi:hypothetical protein
MIKCVTCNSQASFYDSKHPHLTFCNELCQKQNYVGLIINGVNDKDKVGFEFFDGQKCIITKEKVLQSKTLKDLIDNSNNYENYLLLPFSGYTTYYIYYFLAYGPTIEHIFDSINNDRPKLLNLLRAAIFLELNTLIAIIFKRYDFLYEILIPEQNSNLFTEFRNYLPLSKYFKKRYEPGKGIDAYFDNFKMIITKPFQAEFENEHFFRVARIDNENIYTFMMRNNYLADAKFITSIPLTYGPYDFKEFDVNQNDGLALYRAIQEENEEFVELFLNLENIKLTSNLYPLIETVITSNNVTILKMFLEKQKDYYNLSELINLVFDDNNDKWRVFLYLLKQPNVVFLITYDTLSYLLTEDVENLYDILEEFKRYPTDDIGIDDSISLLEVVMETEFELFKLVYSLLKPYIIDISIRQIFNLLSEAISHPETFKFLYRNFNAYIELNYNEETEQFELVDHYGLEEPFILETTDETRQMLNEIFKNKRNKIKFLIRQCSFHFFQGLIHFVGLFCITNTSIYHSKTLSQSSSFILLIEKLFLQFVTIIF